MKNTDVAYAAGSIDSDGCISIRRSTRRLRNKRDCRNPIYSPRISLGHVTPQVPEFLRSMFGGCLYQSKPGTRNSKPIFKWQVSDQSAFFTAKTILPFLKVKNAQAEALMELHAFKSNWNHRRLSYWYAKENPEWMHGELVTAAECARMLGYRTSQSVSQAIAQGTILCVGQGRNGRRAVPRIPRAFLVELAKLKGSGTKLISCKQMVSGQHMIWEKVAALNKVGINGTCVNHRTGTHVAL